jgi:RNA polymerase sigma factor (sigma-70 family)
LVLEGVRAGDDHAFEELYSRYEKTVRGAVRSVLGPIRQDVDDITQEVWITVKSHPPDWRGDLQFASWLYQVARRKALDLVRRRDPLRRSQSLDGLPETSAETDPSRAAELREVLQTILTDTSVPHATICYIANKILKYTPEEVKARANQTLDNLLEELFQRIAASRLAGITPQQWVTYFRSLREEMNRPVTAQAYEGPRPARTGDTMLAQYRGLDVANLVWHVHRRFLRKMDAQPLAMQVRPQSGDDGAR